MVQSFSSRSGHHKWRKTGAPLQIDRAGTVHGD